MLFIVVFFFQAEDGIRDLVRSRRLGDVYKRQVQPATVHPAHPAVKRMMIDAEHMQLLHPQGVACLSLIHI